jgi:two-component system, chemotaxis family, protein-glutamate methylesterase/glutaminase
MKDQKRILIVDDSATYRSLIQSVLKEEEDIKVVGSVASGQAALDFIRATPPDIVTLDVEMPGMNGIDTLLKIQAYLDKNPQIPKIGIIMVSAFTRKNTDTTIKALEAGAFDFIPKPETNDIQENTDILRRQLLVKIRHFAISHYRKSKKDLTNLPKQPQVERAAAVPPHLEALEKVEPGMIQAILIGISTGGPKALVNMLPTLSQKIHLPIFIVQHMPATFTQSLAETLNSRCGHRVIEINSKELVEPDTIYLASGGKHMLLLKNRGTNPIVMSNEEPPVNGFRPSVDVLFRSAAPVYGGNLIALVMTGMGSDGTRGMGTLKRLGAYNIVQDEATSIVWGMPQSAIEAGYVDKIVPLEKIPDAIHRIVNKKR